MLLRPRLSAWKREAQALGLRNWIDLKRRHRRSRGLPRTDLRRFCTPHSSAPLYFRPQSSDFAVLYQIFVEREYRCLDQLSTADLVIDLGANVGYSSAYFMTRYPQCRLFAVEPDAGNFAMLERNLASFSDRATLLNTGVWSRATGLVISTDSRGANMEWAVTVREARADEQATMQAVDIETLLMRSGCDRISLLKMDIEGSEAQVFAQNFKGWLDKTDNLVVELHGEDCERIFHSAISDAFEVSRCDELTVCKRRV